LRDKVGSLALAATNSAPIEPAAGPLHGGVTGDAVSALVNLGYRRAEAFGAVAAASRRLGDGATIDALIRAGLQELSQMAAGTAS
ncbi:MAG TPA: Holliday junction branch migration protein RuvA, partial [Stellaceae bacterium]|nr:Holliday junction branch migration protein RuvA [Stellaceae bacterium]